MNKEINLRNIYRRKTCPLCRVKLTVIFDNDNILQIQRKCRNCKLTIYRNNFNIFHMGYAYVVAKDTGSHEVEWRIHPGDKEITCSYWIKNSAGAYLVENLIFIDYVFPLTITDNQIRTLQTFG